MQYLKAAVGLRNGTGSEAPAVSTSALTLEESMVTVTSFTLIALVRVEDQIRAESTPLLGETDNLLKLVVGETWVEVL
jgi:hypothetical protein